MSAWESRVQILSLCELQPKDCGAWCRSSRAGPTPDFLVKLAPIPCKALLKYGTWSRGSKAGPTPAWEGCQIY